MRILYGNSVLHDPTLGIDLLDVELTCSLREASTLTFKMPRQHDTFGKIVLESVQPEIEVWEGDTCLMRGRAYSCEDVDNVGTVEYACEGELAYLNDISVRPYSTVPGEAPTFAPVDPYGYFEWIIAAYNVRVEPVKQMRVGVNQGHMLDDNDHILRSDSTYPNIGKVIKDKLLDKLGGFVRARYEDGVRYVDYLADTDGTASQRIEFGSNLLKFARTRDGSQIYSVVIPLGEKPDDSDSRITVSSLADGNVDAYGRYIKSGDAIRSVDLIAKVGYRECAVEWDDVSEVKYLPNKAVSWLAGQADEIETIKITAFDLSRIDKDVEPINIGDYVRVTSAPHDYDSYMIVSKIVYRPSDPNGDEYTFGIEGDDIGDVVRKHAQTLNSGINKVYEQADSIGKIAQDAQDKANAAATETTDEYALSDSSSEPPSSGWSPDTPAWTPGKYIWRRVVTTHGDGATSVGAPALMTGNAGADGEDATLALIMSSAGDSFKNNQVSTKLSAVVFHGAKRITDYPALVEEYGETARVVWSWQRLGEDRFGVISATDARLGDNGMSLTISPDDVDAKTDFLIEVHRD